MPTFDFLSYLPDYADLTAEQIAAARAKIVTIVESMSPNLDTRPGSPFGDNMVSQLALIDAARSVAASRMLNDLDTEAVSKGIIYNCDVARAFVGNFALASIADVKARGLVRLTFDRATFFQQSVVVANGFLVLNRGIQFLFNSTDVFKLSLARDDQSEFIIWKPGYRSNAIPGVDQFFAQESMTGDIYVDVPVMGTMVSPILDGASGLIDKTVPALKSVKARSDFLSGFPAEDIPSLAKRSRQVAYASSLSCKAGAAGFVLTEFPSAAVVSPITNGDAPLTRGTDQSLFLLQKPCLDIYVRSSVVLYDTIVVRLPVFAGLSTFFAGNHITFNHVPIRITAVWLPDAPAVTVGLGSATVAEGTAKGYIASSTYSGSPGEVSRTDDELFYVAVELSNADEVLAVKTSGDGDYIVLAITYAYDPLLLQVASVAQSPRHAPAGVSVKCRGFCPIVIDELGVNYMRAPGTTVNIGQASSEILEDIRGLGWPDTFTRTGISNSVTYAGCRALRNLSVVARTVTGVANYIRTVTGPFASPANVEDVQIEIENMLVIPEFTITDEVSLNVDNVQYGGPDFSSFATWSSFCEAWKFGKGNQTTRWLLDDSSLYFEEVLS